jgi:hypothetical protein
MTSRRQMLKSSLALAAGAIGIGAAAKAIGGADPPGAMLATGGKPPQTLVLVGRNVHAVTVGKPAGHGPEAGDRTALSGEILDASGGVLGHFLGSSTALDPTFDEVLPHGAAIETHTFRLAGGTIHGMGTAEDGEDSEFAIVGGTGRYVGARGSYTARHLPIELGGDGSAAFTMTFTR